MRISLTTMSLFAAISFVTATQDTAPVVHQGPLAFVRILPAKHSFKVGEPIEVTVLLEAGQDGVYVAKTWGQAGGAVPGFFLWLETAAGKPAQTCGSSVDADPRPEPDDGKSLQRHFIFLNQGEIIGWKTTIECPLQQRGNYRIVARYNPNKPETHRVASLPETKGLVLQQSVEAKPVEISIR